MRRAHFLHEPRDRDVLVLEALNLLAPIDTGGQPPPLRKLVVGGATAQSIGFVLEAADAIRMNY